MPHNLTEKQERVKVKLCMQMLKKFNRGRSSHMWDIITGNETRIFSYNPKRKQQSAVWVFPGKAPPMKFKRSQCVAKQTVSCFFKSGHVATIPLKDPKMVNSDWYINCWLPKALEEWCTHQLHGGTKGLQLYRDNASAHTAAATLNFLVGNSEYPATHPPYSQDLALCDWFLLPFITKPLQGIQFQNPEDN